MNRGLFGNPLPLSTGSAAIFNSRPKPLTGSGIEHVERHPFSTPIVAQSILVCKNAVRGFAGGDYFYDCSPPQNSTVNTTGSGFTKCSPSQVGFIAGSGSAQSGRYNQFIDGSIGAFALPTDWYEIFTVLGPQNIHDPGTAHLPSARFWRTRPKPYVLTTNYITPNLLGVTPAMALTKLLCLSPDAGYAAGDELDAYTYQVLTANAVSFCIRANEKIVEYRTPDSGGAIVPHGSTGAQTSVTVGKWACFLELIG
jgi:hypothetical protein